MPRWGMVIDLDRCTACQACVVACRQENNVAFSGPDGTQKRQARFWMEVLSSVHGDYPKVQGDFIPRPCMHCDNPPCVQVCPVGATYKNEQGVVLQNYERCIGCKYCMVACPYQARFMNWDKPEQIQPMNNYLNPDVPLRPKGIVEKCTFCIQRIEKAEAGVKQQGRALQDGDVITACTQTCTGGAIHFGDLDNPNSTVYGLAHNRRAIRLLEELGTEPKVYYLTEG